MKTKTLQDVLPYEFSTGSYNDDKAYKFKDVIVTKKHDGTVDRWIGTHKNVYVWYELKNGYAVGWNESPSRGWSFPVVKIK